MSDLVQACLVLIPSLPLAAAVVAAVLGPRVLRQHSHWPVVAALACSFLASVVLLQNVWERQQAEAAETASPLAQTGYERVITLWTWADVPQAYQQERTPPGEGRWSVVDGGPRDFRVEVALRADPLTCMMLCMVTFVATLVALFAGGYMQGDPGYWRFFAYLGLFVFSMTMLVSVSNFLLLFVFWEAVGACSYLLIGFWYQKPEAAAAGKKAFLVNRIGDFGFALGIFLLWTTYGTLNFHDSLATGETEPAAISAAVEQAAQQAVHNSGGESPREAPQLVRGILGRSRLAANDYVTGSLALAICLLLMLGACGKSAQFPLHVWLPDAMEGPTPVSALIHAATMVTAGVYMVARCSPLFAASPEAQLAVAGIGGFTALLAGLTALTQWDLKRVLAYSTVSQLGFMFLALGAGTVAGVTAGMFHLFTHAFFKALLFLGAGSVMHAMGNVIDMRQFGGLRRIMPHTHWTFLFGCLALAGIVPFAGFWSKDSILGAVHDKIHALDHELEHRHGGGHGPEAAEHAPPATAAAAASAAHNPYAAWSDGQLATARSAYQWLYYGAIFTAFLTAFYTFRAYCLTFHGELRVPPAAGHHAHESPGVMVGPLAVLAISSLLVGVLFLNPANLGQNYLADFIAQAPSLAAGGLAATAAPARFHLDVAWLSTLIAVAGMGLALYLYLGERSEARSLAGAFDGRGLDRLTDLEWIPRLRRIGWIAWLDRRLRAAGLGWTFTLIGYALGLLSLVLVAPLLLLNFVTPYKLSYHKFYFDELYAALIVAPLHVLAVVLAWLDRWVVDGLVDFIGAIPPAIGSLMRSLQMGLLQFYALAMALGVILLLAARILWAL